MNWGIKPPDSWRDEEGAKEEANLVLVGRIISDKEIALYAAREVLARAWSFDKSLVILELAKNTFLWEFSSREARDRTLQRQPWSIKGHVLVLQVWPPGLLWQEINLVVSPVWVQIHRLPLERSNEITAKFVGEATGTVLEIEGSADKKVWCVPFIRVRELLNTCNPLPSGYTLFHRELDPVRILFKYEHIMGFCYHAGAWAIGNLMKVCLENINLSILF